MEYPAEIWIKALAVVPEPSINVSFPSFKSGSSLWKHVNRIMQRQVLRFMSFSYKKEGFIQALTSPSLLWHKTTFRIVLCCLHRLYFVVSVIPEEGLAGLVLALDNDKDLVTWFYMMQLILITLLRYPFRLRLSCWCFKEAVKARPALVPAHLDESSILGYLGFHGLSVIDPQYSIWTK